jgi:hypothetical protein
MVNSYQAAAVKELKKAKELDRMQEQETLIAQQKQKARAHDARMKEIAAKEARIANGEPAVIEKTIAPTPAAIKPVVQKKTTPKKKKVTKKKDG